MKKQMLYYGDNLDILRKYIESESIDLCYIDPPFNSKRNYNQIYNNIGKEDRAQSIAFVDTWEWNTRAEEEYREICLNENGKFTAQTSDLIMGLYKILGRGSLLSYLISMTLRVNEIHRVLKPTGSFYLHCDPTASHYLKIVLDAIFCGQGGNFLNEIIWCYRGGGSPKKDFGRRHDIIFRCSKSNDYIFNDDEIRIPYEAEGLNRKDDAMWGKHKGADKVYKPHPLGKIPEDWWLINIINANSPERLGYPTQKPEALLERIIKASSNEGDVVLDAFCGCGTTVAVAQKLNRKWIGIDITYQSISLIKKRLTDVYGNEILNDITESGIPADMESAKALAAKKDDRLRKEFEKWAILTYSDNTAMINDRKGKDYGIDGRTRILSNVLAGVEEYKDVLFSVKSGNVGSKDIRDFRGTIEREDAAAGIFITLKEPTKDMKREAVTAGFFSNEHTPRAIEKIKIVTIEQILAGGRSNLPLASKVFKEAKPEINEQITIE